MSVGKPKKHSEQKEKKHDMFELEFSATHLVHGEIAEKAKVDAPVAKENEGNVLPIGNAVAEAQLNEAEVRAQVAEAKTEIVALYAQEAKLLEQQMDVLIKKVFAQNPELKPYLLRMKKLLADHSDIKKIMDKDPLKKSA
ncbi:hypothetical protein HBN50_11680 [Halobacteriovorax sp. GB3]|uniref:hypothetical protein n=1 Tax=Halobacteriovorax sp. GB3 TaxID=2719615 RepID=UPI0023616985|nr:hypothetical protein [Halobacteriovorax sp. GB3]MDD0853761.1 hypothetical protein [Halobacteriovorax sp. GB3]